MPFAVEADSLTKLFGSFVALDNLSLQVEEGEIFGLLGPNGAGKTTTIRILSCLLNPTAGRATVAGYDVVRQPQEVRRSIGLLPELPGLYERMTAYENLEYYGQLYGLSGAALSKRVNSLLETMGLWERRDEKVGAYSKGMRQKLAVARALVHDPPVLFLDEPTSALDPEAQRRIHDDITALSKERKRTILLCTHNLAEAEKLCDRVAIINHGRTIAVGGAESLRNELSTRRTFKLVLAKRNEAVLHAIDATGLCERLEGRGETILFSVTSPERDNPLIVDAVVSAGGRIMSLAEVKMSLEDIYLRIIGES
ncbi:MAG: ATP-binding cassette domain-containing protein [Candidatus Bathyarchaeia archaeon]